MIENYSHLPPEILREIVLMLDGHYFLIEQDKKYAVLSCEDCGEKWSVKIPKKNSALAEVVAKNGCCIRCHCLSVVRA